MQRLLRALLRKAGVESGNRFNQEWRLGDILRTGLRILLSYGRGVVRRVGFGSSAGLVLIGKSVIVRHPRHLHVGPGFVAEDRCEIQALSRRGIVFGSKVTVGSFALIRPTNFYGGELGEGLLVGDHSNIGPYCYVGCSGYVEIGAHVMISPRVSIYAENHVFERTDLPMKAQGVRRGQVKIEDDCWIASHSVILSGVTIGRGSVVAAGSVVTKDVPPFSIVGGVPARVIKRRKGPSRKPAARKRLA